TPDGWAVVSGSDDGIRRWEARTGARLPQAALVGRTFLAVTTSGDLITTKPGKLSRYRAGTDELVCDWDVGGGRVTAGVVSCDGERVAVGGEERSIRAGDASTGKPLWEQHRDRRNSGAMLPLDFSADGRVLATLEQGSLCFRDATTGAETSPLPGMA